MAWSLHTHTHTHIHTHIHTHTHTHTHTPGPLIGRIVDLHGARSALLVSQLASVITYLLILISSNTTILFVSQLPTLLQHPYLSGQACVSIISSSEERARLLGHLSISYGLGFVLGPWLGGVLARVVGYSGVAVVAALLTLVALPMNLLLMPVLKPGSKGGRDYDGNLVSDDVVDPLLPRGGGSSNSNNDNNFNNYSFNNNNNNNSSSNNNFSSSSSSSSNGSAGSLAEHIRGIWIVMRRRDLQPWLLLNLPLGLAMILCMTGVEVSSSAYFNLNEASYGLAMSFMGIASTVSNLFVVGWIVATFDKRTVILSMISLLTFALACLPLASSLTTLLMAIIPISLSMSVLRIVIISFMTNAIPIEERGTAIGISHSVGAFCGVISPVLAGYLYQSFGFQAISAVAVLFTSAALLHAYRITAGVVIKEEKLQKKA